MISQEKNKIFGGLQHSWGLDFVTSLCVIDREQFEVTKSSVNTIILHGEIRPRIFYFSRSKNSCRVLH